MAVVGVATLETLSESPLLGDDEKRLIDAALDAILSERDDQLDEVQSQGDVPLVIEQPFFPPGSTLDASATKESGDD